jgi:NAD(P)-dependent dehydrogenase (short-subunit alcohol dehydrogenase family)
VRISGSAVLVTGGASGIGAAIVDELRRAGAQVVIADRDDADVVVDLSEPGAAEQMVVQAVARLGPLDVLVNNAGGYRSPTYPANEEWRATIELNLLAAMEAIKAALPALANRSGCVVNIGSTAALGGQQYQGIEYAVAKAGLLRLTSALGTVEGVRVNCVCPHTVATEAVLRDLESRSLVEIAPPPPTILAVEEVVGAVRQLIEDDSLAGRVLLLVGGEEPRYLDEHSTSTAPRGS